MERIIQYIKKQGKSIKKDGEVIRENGKTVGCLVAVKDGEDVYIGYSLCDKHDKFDKKKARRMAEVRATKKRMLLEYKEEFYHNTFHSYFPQSIKKDLEVFVEKSKWKFHVDSIKNYQDKHVVTPCSSNTTDHMGMAKGGVVYLTPKSEMGFTFRSS